MSAMKRLAESCRKDSATCQASADVQSALGDEVRAADYRGQAKAYQAMAVRFEIAEAGAS
jgi:hypothetical protein